MRGRTSLLGLVAALLAVDGCASREEAPPDDPAFLADYVDDYENDLEEDAAEAAEEARLDALDDLDDLAELDAPLPATKSGKPARAPHGPLSILQDDAYFLWPDAGRTAKDNFEEAHQLGADVIRVFVSWKDTVRTDFRATTKPVFDATDPNQYDWSRLDALFDGARNSGLRVLVTLGSPIPYWASEDPARCLERETRVPEWSKHWCSWKPQPREFAMWVTALGRHLVATKRVPWAVTLWNEPNLSFFLADDGGTEDPDDNRWAVGVRYRKMWFVGRKALRKTAGLTTRVLFADMANGVTTPAHWTTLHYALCLPDPRDPPGHRPPCPARARKVYAHGVAYHPYAKNAAEVERSIKMLERYLDAAAQKGRISYDRGIYLTEHGFLTQGLVSLDTEKGLGAPETKATPMEQAVYDNRVVRYAFTDKRVRSVAQFLLRDQGDGRWESGLRFNDVIHPDNPRRNEEKPAYGAYKMVIDVIDRGDDVEIFGLARSCKYGFIVEGQSADGTFRELSRVDTDALGYGVKILPKNGRTHFRLWCGLDVRSRVASPRTL